MSFENLHDSPRLRPSGVNPSGTSKERTTESEQLLGGTARKVEPETRVAWGRCFVCILGFLPKGLDMF